MADRTTKPIKDIKVGDKVTATDPATGKTTTEPVTQLHLNTDTDLTDIAVAPASATASAAVLAITGSGSHRPTSILHTTAHHPFWDATTHRGTNAGNLTPGHHLIGPEGQLEYVAGVHNYPGAKDMRNLTVATIQTHYA